MKVISVPVVVVVVVGPLLTGATCQPQARRMRKKKPWVRVRLFWWLAFNAKSFNYSLLVWLAPASGAVRTQGERGRWVDECGFCSSGKSKCRNGGVLSLMLDGSTVVATSIIVHSSGVRIPRRRREMVSATESRCNHKLINCGKVPGHLRNQSLLSLSSALSLVESTLNSVLKHFYFFRLCRKVTAFSIAQYSIFNIYLWFF